MDDTLKLTCLHGAHLALGAKMSPFAGFDMPIQYSGIRDEHLAVRGHAGIFDVSHMGEIFVSGPDALRFVNHIFTGDVSPMTEGQCQYGMMLYPDGGTVDDLLAIREGCERRWATPSGGGLDWAALPSDIAEGLESGDKSILSAGGFSLRKKIDQSNLWTVRDLRNARHYLLELREMLVSCSLPEDLLLETKLLQAIGLKRAKK